jgi:GH24 family phage-related lysozyme (muramidase)
MKQRQQPVGSPNQRRWRIYSTFLTGLLIGLFYAVLISEKFAGAMTALDETYKVLKFIDQRTLVLVFSGLLGGVIYTIVVDGYVEIPRFTNVQRDGVNAEDGFKAGLFGDILLGIAGALVLDFLTSPVGLTMADRENFLKNSSMITSAAKGIVGGYGGKAILVFALEKVFRNVERLEKDKERYAEESLQNKLDSIGTVQLLDQLNDQIKAGLPDAELIKLQQDIRAASSSIKQQIFNLVEDVRSAGNFSEVTRPRIERTIPIFVALRDSDPQNHTYYAELAYAYKDAVSPDRLKALEYIDQAIALRGDRVEGNTWKYELNRAILRIQQGYTKTNSYVFDAALQELVIQDLLTVARNYNLTNVLADAKRKKIPSPILDWMRANEPQLEQREDVQHLMSQMQASIVPEVASPVIVTPPPPVPSIPTFVPIQPQKPIQPLPTIGADDILSAAIAFIKEFEKFCAEAYPDLGKGWDLPTIGYGTTRYPNGRPVQQHEKITEQQAEAYVYSHIKKICKPALEKIPQWNQMNGNQKAALYSFAYNVGEDFYQGEDFDSITSVCDSPDRWHDRAWIEAQFVKYCKSAGKVMDGLRDRRLKEAELFCTPTNVSSLMTRSSLDIATTSTVIKTMYVQQPNNQFCQAACIAMVLGVTDVDAIHHELVVNGKTAGDPAVMGDYLKPRVESYQFLVDGSLNDARKALDEGYVVITHGWFTPAGHVILLIGHEADPDTFSFRFIVHDPWAEYNFPRGDHDDDKSGEGVRYSSYGIYATCVGSADYNHACDLYNRKALDLNEKNGWLHIIRT